jgi:hypothetical protein
MPSGFVTLSDEDFVREAICLVDKAKENGVILRVIGALAVYLHSRDHPEALKLYNTLQRFGEGKPKFTDLDLMAYSAQRNLVRDFFEKTVRFKPDVQINTLFGHKRLVYCHPKNYYHVDVFFDKLEFSHDVLFGSKPGSGRLEMDYPTISLADIILTKTQIHQINIKDVVDLIILFAGHDVDEEVGQRVASVLSDDWGFWYDATTNLNKVKRHVEALRSDSKISNEQYELIKGGIDKLLTIIARAPKTKNWLKRAKIGTSKSWYRDVEEIVR